ncbi:Putative uncharacterized protein [Taphrina deformans PYCC 5710]|uniref:tripeptidyl-peptidase II n=1 Tax=Taphrina deformans (strain PYCC 5710 / ATCC 11124 / CBS 356.35 / IMI 108563 / JCM 9778 / NBRC 8474) TaxID=1097556 RepID=R4XGH7_TAPDE|nr:Putative uncharacterized protein [Taphrina deformans PYCC 5710]|eukprot:CCG82474.1 Putative uncharacterized protein [Taphrina deformans PYCC 5710]
MLPNFLLEVGLILASYGALAASTPHMARTGYTVKERVTVPREWSKYEGRVDKSKAMTLRIGLVRPNARVAEDTLKRISDPQHRDYGKHLSMAEVKKLMAPAQVSVDHVMRWLGSHAVPTRDVELVGDFIHVRVPVRKAEQLLDTEYNGYHHKGTKLVRALQYSLPNHLHEHIDLIQPTTLFGSLHAHAREAIRIDGRTFRAEPAYPRADTSYNVTIASLRTLYNIGNYSAVNGNTSIAIASYLEEYANFADYVNFTNAYVPYLSPNGTLFNVTLISNGTNSQNLTEAGSEADLDVQYAFGLSGAPLRTVYATGGRPPFTDDAVLNGTNSNEPYLDFLNYVLASNYTSNATIPQVISTSYGDDEQSVPQSYAERVCQGFMTLGLLGTSVIFSSGDTGVGPGGNVTDAQCRSNVPGPTFNRTVFLPAFPASCPYVTVVGGTTRQAPEVAVEILDRRNTTAGGFFSGGGFSNYFTRPAYQEASVTNYLPSIPANYTSRALYNESGRAYPDVSTQSWRFAVFNAGSLIEEGGTSASAPTFAGIVALLNDARATAGLPTLGFLNPLLYALQNVTATTMTTTNATMNATMVIDPRASSIVSSARSSATSRAILRTNGSTPFNDITVGSNPGCGTNGFPTAPGWDPVTGLGSPNFAALVNATGGRI